MRIRMHLLLSLIVLSAIPFLADSAMMAIDECPRLLLSVRCDSASKDVCCPVYLAEAHWNIGPDYGSLHFVWSLSGGRIIEGSGGPVIRFDTSGFKGKSIEVKVRVEGLKHWPKACATEIALTIDPCKEKKKSART